MKRYEGYKSSGVEWMPVIPKHWEAIKLKWVCSFVYGEALSSDVRIEGSIPVFGSNGITGVHNTSITEAPSIIIGRKGSFGRINYSIEPCFPIDTTYYVDQRVTKHHLRWLYYALGILGLDKISKDTGVPGLSREDAYNHIVPVPPLREQRIIACFLDEKTGQIDQLITQKQQMLKLLQEERAAIINHAVTKGLDAAAPVRASGIEWLGQVPAHWEVKRLKFISPNISVGLVINPSTYHDDNGTIPMISGKNVTEHGIDVSDVKYITEESNNSLLPSKLNAGDLVSIRVGYPGLTAVIPEELDGINCASVMIIRKGPQFHSPFLALLMNSPVGMQQVDIVAYGSAQKQFNVGHAIEFVFPLPPLEEQLSIVERLTLHTDKIDETCIAINQEIALLQEYRAALISEAVTGQIDVRNYESTPILTAELVG